MGRAAQRKVAEHLTWDASVAHLRALYAAHGLADDWIPKMEAIA
jgi:hypothetical protein